MVSQCSAKALIDQRIALEAKRMRHHSQSSIAQIGHQIGLQIGFTEPTNFVKFFRRIVATTPQAFCEHRG